MIETLKSELKLRPTYDEMIGMIEAQGDPNRPPIEQVIDRRATLFRNNQFGSQFDNIDFLGLKKQEEDRAKENLRQAQVQNAGIQAGESTGIRDITDYRRQGFVTPSETELSDPDEMDRFYANLENFSRQQREREQSAISRINASILGDTERYREMVRQQQFEISEMAKNDLVDVHGQVLPAGVPVHSMASEGDDTMPDLIPIDEDEEDIKPNPYQRGLLYWNNDIEKMKTNQKINYDDLLFQLHIRGQLTDKMETDVENLPDELSKKLYLLRVIENLIGTEPEDNEWQTMVNDELLKKRIKEWRDRGKTRGRKSETQIAQSSSSSSSTPLRDIAVAGAKAGVETLAKAGATAIAKSFLPT